MQTALNSFRKEFKAVCNHYFDRLHSQKNEANKEEIANFEAKKVFLDSLESLSLEGDYKKDMVTITAKIKEWKGLVLSILLFWLLW